MPYFQGCLFVEAYQIGDSKVFRNPQLSGTIITYSGSGTAVWSSPEAVLEDQNGNNLGVGSATLTPVFVLSGNGSSGAVAMNMTQLLAYKDGIPARKAAYKRIWDAFTGNGRLILTVQTNVGAQEIRVELRALKSANYSLTSSSRTAHPDYPEGVTPPDFNFEGESEGNYTAQFEIPQQSTLMTASFAPDDFSIPNGNLPPPNTYSATLVLTRSFSTDSNGDPCSTYHIASGLPSIFKSHD